MVFKFLQKCNNIPLSQGNCKRLDHNLNLWLFMYDTKAMLAAESQRNEKSKKRNYSRYTMNPLQRIPPKLESVEQTSTDPFEKVDWDSCEGQTTTITQKLDHLGRTLKYLTTDKYKRISPEMLEMLDNGKEPKFSDFKWLQPVKVGTNSKIDKMSDGNESDLPSSLVKHLHDAMKTTEHTNRFYGINFYEKKFGPDKNAIDYLDPNALGAILAKLKDSQMIDDVELDHLVRFLITALHADSEMVGQLLELLKARGLLTHDIINYLKKLLELSVSNEAFAEMMERLEDVFEVFKKSDLDKDDPYENFGDVAKFFTNKVRKGKKRGPISENMNMKSRKKVILSDESMSEGNQRSVYKIGSKLKASPSKGGGVYIFGEDYQNEINYDDPADIPDDLDGRGDQLSRIRSQNLSFNKRYGGYERDEGKYQMNKEGNQKSKLRSKKRGFWYNLGWPRPTGVDLSDTALNDTITSEPLKFLARSKVKRLADPHRSFHLMSEYEKLPPQAEFYGNLTTGGFFKPWPVSLGFKDKQKFFRLSTAKRAYGREFVSIKKLKSEKSLQGKVSSKLGVRSKLDTNVTSPKANIIRGSYYVKEYSNRTALATIKSANKVRLPTHFYQ